MSFCNSGDLYCVYVLPIKKIQAWKDSMTGSRISKPEKRVSKDGSSGRGRASVFAVVCS